MKIKKVLNNNAVVAIGDDRQEVVVTGLGLAFKKSKGDILDSCKIERIFRMENQEVSRKLRSLVDEIPVEYVEITEEIVVEAKKALNKELNENIYLTLTDHISFAVERIEKGYVLSNPMAWEIRHYYVDEFKVGLQALEIVKRRLGTELPQDEAASIAMHIVNAELNEDMPNVVTLIKVLQDSLNIIKYHFQVDFDEESLHYGRLVTHLKFFAQRIIKGECEEESDEALYEVVSDQYVEASACARKIKKYAKEKYKFEVSKAEMTYLIVHIERVIQSSRGME